jgi:excisionase family DNA binding protein
MDTKSEAALACSVNEAAGLVGVSRSRLYLEIASGRLRVRKVGKRTIVETAALRDWLAAQALGGPAARAKVGRA